MAELRPSSPEMNEADRRDAESHRTLEVLYEVGRERGRQDERWGEQNHGDSVWAAILGEEFGEVCQEVLERKFGRDSGIDPHSTPREALRAELIQVAAVAVAWVEKLDRG